MAAVVVGALASAVGLSGIVSTVATSLLGAVSSFTLSSLAAKPKRTTTLSASERTEMVRSPALPRRLVYGRARVSGPLVFASTSDSSSKTKHDVLHLVIPLAGHEVAELEALYVNDEKVVLIDEGKGWLVPPVGSAYRKASGLHALQARFHAGTIDQRADEVLCAAVPQWTPQHRLQGVAYLYVCLLWDGSIWSAGLPNISAIIKGRPVFDPRTGLMQVSSNPALCIRDYLLSPFGLGCLADELDEASFMAAASLCDEWVHVTGGADERRYALNGVITLDQKPIDVMEQMLSACAGALVYAQGRYKLYPAAFRAPAVSLGEGVLRAPLKVRPQASLKEKANTIRGTFIDASQNWQQTDFSPVSLGNTVQQDGGVVARELDLPFTTSAAMAERLARLQLERLKAALIVEMPCTLAALPVAVMEPVRVSVAQLGWEEKTFLPTEWSMTPEGGIDVVLQADDPAFYAWDGGAGLMRAVEAVTLPDLHPALPLLNVTDGSTPEGAARLVIDLDSLEGAFVSRYDVAYRAEGDEAFISLQGGTRQYIDNVALWTVYEVRARAINTLGLMSAWVGVRHQAVGDVQPPQTVPFLSGCSVDGSVYLDWAQPLGTVSGYRLRWSAALSGASWQNALDVTAALARTAVQAVVPARRGTYLLKAVGPLGAESAAAASFVNMTPDGRSTNDIAVLTEAPSFAGVKTNCALDASGALVIDSLVAFDAQEGLFDAALDVFDAAGGGVQPEGVYSFASLVDLGAVYLVRVAADVVTSVVDFVLSFEDGTGDFDQRDGAFDGTAPSAVDVLVEMATTQTNPTASPIWSDWQPASLGDVAARGFKFRARLLSRNAMASPVVSALSVRVEVPDRVSAGASVVSVASGAAISFSPAFYAPPAVSVTGQALQAGDRVLISAISRTGFTVQFVNSAGTGVVRTFDWVARGFGREV